MTVRTLRGHSDPPPLSAAPPAAVRRQRLRGADLRNRLVPAAAARHRIVGGLARRAARHVHGRHVPRQPAAAALHRRARSIRCASTRCSSSASALIGLARCCSGCRSSAASTPAWAGRGSRLIVPRHRRGHLPAAADAADGRDAAGDCALGRDDAARACRGSGFFYGGNIAGAVIGSLLAGFYLLRVFDMAIATYVAVALNVARRARSACCIANATPYEPPPRSSPDAGRARAPERAVGLRRDRAVRH